MEEYCEVAHLYRRYHRCLIVPDQQELVNLGHTLLPLPTHLDKEGEDWLRLAAMILKSMPKHRGGEVSTYQKHFQAQSEHQPSGFGNSAS
jgi:hypothetical protein